VRGGFPYEGGPIQVVVCERGVGLFLARRMEELYLAWRSGDEKAFAELLDAARLYADHIAQHIDKENGVFFPMLEGNIREVESGKTVEDVERENRHEEWLKTLEEVKRRLGA
jgi:hemerythrin-like domain-containing protein